MRTFKNKFHVWEFKIQYITEVSEATIVINKLKNKKILFGFDIETGKKPAFRDNKQAGLDPILSRIRLLQFYDDEDKISYVFDAYTLGGIEIFRPLVESGRFVGHHAIFEIMFMSHNGFPDMNVGCSMLLSQIIDGAEHSPFESSLLPGEEEEDDEDQNGLSRYRIRGHSLDALIQRLYGVQVAKQEQNSNWDAPQLTPSQITYAGLDAVLTLKAARDLSVKLVEYKMTKPYKLLKDMQHVVAKMQLQGIPVDWDYHKGLISGWEEKQTAAMKECEPYFGDTNMRSGKQMSQWLITYAKTHFKNSAAILSDWPKTKKGGYAFSKTAIASMSKLPAIKALLEYKKYPILLSTFGESLREKKHPLTENVHSSYTLGMTTTGRLSSRNPNSQNYPRDKSFRNMFVAKKGHVLVVSDFSQIELRLQAEFSQDPEMLKVFRENRDIYSEFASQYFGFDIQSLKANKKEEYDQKRMFGKVVMLALGYGMGAKKLGEYAANTYSLKLPHAEWAKAHKLYHTKFVVYSRWCTRMRDRAEKLGYIETLLGKRRKLVSSEMFTRAPNTVIQGSAAELMMVAMLICDKKVSTYASIIGTVHDEVLLHCKKEFAEKGKKDLADSMNEAMKLMFPKAATTIVAEAGYGEKWGDVKKAL